MTNRASAARSWRRVRTPSWSSARLQPTCSPPPTRCFRGSNTCPRRSERARCAIRRELRRASESFRNEPPALQGRLIVVMPLVGAFRELDLVPPHLGVWNQLEHVRDAVEPRAPLVVG